MTHTKELGSRLLVRFVGNERHGMVSGKIYEAHRLPVPQYHGAFTYSLVVQSATAGKVYLRDVHVEIVDPITLTKLEKLLWRIE